jgi:hypothetical protein
MKTQLTIPFLKPETLRDLFHHLQGEVCAYDDSSAKSEYRQGYEGAIRTMRDNLALWLLADVT